MCDIYLQKWQRGGGGGVRPAARCPTGGDLWWRENEDGQLQRK